MRERGTHLTGTKREDEASDRRWSCAQPEWDIGDVQRACAWLLPVAALAEWARAREAEGRLIDPKVWAGLCLARSAGAVE